MSKDYIHLNRTLVLSYFWKVIRQFPRTFYSVVFFTILVGILDVYIPFQFLKLWNVLSGTAPGGGPGRRRVGPDGDHGRRAVRGQRGRRGCRCGAHRERHRGHGQRHHRHPGVRRRSGDPA